MSAIFHGTHFDKLIDICTGDYAILKGNPKQWRLLDYKDFREGYCSYYVEQGEPPVPMTEIPSKFDLGPVLWFSTKTDEADLYGPFQVEISINSTIEAYQRMRGKNHKICYRAAGTLVYKGEVNHVVLICCEEDENLLSFPLITGNNTKYFKPPAELCNGLKDPTDTIFQVAVNDYHKKLKYAQRRDNYDRHEHVSIAMYIPQKRKLFFDKKNATVMLTSHEHYCIQSRRKECKFKNHLSISQLKQHVPWITTPAETEILNNSDCQANQSCSFASSEEPNGQHEKTYEDNLDRSSDFHDTEFYVADDSEAVIVKKRRIM